MTPVAQLLPENFVLKAGSHAAAQREMCVMEAVAFVAGEPWSDEPACACPVIGVFLRSWNDAIPGDETRTRLLAPLVPRLVDSKSTNAVQRQRADLALDWLARVQAPVWLSLNPALQSHAAAMRALKPLVSKSAIKESSAALFAARDASAAASAAARDAARAAAWDAARDAARDALLPSVAALQTSALVLVERMLSITPETTNADLEALCDWPVIVING